MPWEYVRAKSQLQPPVLTTIAKGLYDEYIRGDEYKLDFNAKSYAKTKKGVPTAGFAQASTTV